MVKEIDKIKELMKEKGLAKAAIEGKTPGVVLSIVLENPDVAEAFKCVDELSELKKEKDFVYEVVNDLIRERNRLERERDRLKISLAEYSSFARLEDAVKAKNDYIDAFNKSLSQCETKEGRDKLRIAQTFINSVNINTVYDNTAFIRGLAEILSGGDFDMYELRKVEAIKENDYVYGKRKVL